MTGPAQTVSLATCHQENPMNTAPPTPAERAYLRAIRFRDENPDGPTIRAARNMTKRLVAEGFVYEPEPMTDPPQTVSLATWHIDILRPVPAAGLRPKTSPTDVTEAEARIGRITLAALYDPTTPVTVHDGAVDVGVSLPLHIDTVRAALLRAMDTD